MKKFTIAFLIILVFFTFSLFLSRSIRAEATSVSCEFSMFQVDSSYKLSYKYDTAQISNSSWVEPNTYYVYSFIVKTSDSKRKDLTQVLFSQVSGGEEPIEILDVRPQNGSCSIDSSNKSVSCNLSYSFTDSAHYPIEYLVKLKADPKKSTTSSLFSVSTSVGNATCSNWLRIKNEKTANAVNWVTPYVKFSASDFFIRIGDQKFYGKDPVYVHSNLGIDKTTLEVIWQENNVEMRFYLYFRFIEENMWELYEIRTYNGKAQGDWINWRESLGNTISSLIGMHNYADTRTFVPIDGSDGQIYCKSCDITLSMPKPVVPGTKYILEALIGLPKGTVITLSDAPNTSYGVNVLLLDS